MGEIEKNIANVINKSERIALFTHINPDADGLGCLSAFYFLFKENKIVDLFCDSQIPERFTFLGTKEVFNNKEFVANDYDLLISMDAADIARLGCFANDFLNHGNTINIDHHKTNDGFAKFNCIKRNYNSCGEVLFEIIEKMNIKYNSYVATSLYAAIAGDTGRFLFPGVNGLTFKKTALLIDNGADISYVNFELFEKKTIPQFNVLKVLIGNLEIVDEFAISFVTLKEYLKTGGKTSDAEMFYSNITNISGTKATVILKEYVKGEFHVSFRGAGLIDVSKVAKEFGGGGHKNAAGCTVCGTLADVKKRVLTALKTEININE